MDPHAQNEITERLDLMKTSGLLSEYLISWVGQNGKLSPNVTVWKSAVAPDLTVRNLLDHLLSGLVERPRINFIAD